MKLLRIGPGWVLRGAGACLAVDPSDGFAAALALAPAVLDAVLITSPDRGDGLFALLRRLDGRRRPLALYFGAWDPVTPAMVAAWMEVGAQSFDVSLESGLPGEVTGQVGEARIASFPTGQGQGWLVQSAAGEWAFGATDGQALALARRGVTVL